VGDGPARAARDETQPLLPVQPVDLVDHPVDVIAEARAVGLQPAIDVHQSVDALDPDRARIDLEAPGFERRQRAFLGLREGRGSLAPGIGEEGEGAARRDLGIDLAQGAGGEVAGVGVGAAPFRFRRRVEGREAFVGGIDFAPDLDQVGPARARELHRNVGNGLQIGGDVLARAAIAARGALDQDALLIADIGRQPVDLGLCHEGDRIGMRQLQEALDPGHEVGDVALVEGVVERQHGHAVAHLGELAGGGRAHLQRRRIRADQGREARLDGQVAGLQRVVFGVAQFGRRLVVEEVGAAHLRRQPAQLGCGLIFAQGLDRDVGQAV